MITKNKWFTKNACKKILLKINIAFLPFKPAIHVYNYVSKENPRTDKLKGIFHLSPTYLTPIKSFLKIHTYEHTYTHTFCAFKIFLYFFMFLLIHF